MSEDDHYPLVPDGGAKAVSGGASVILNFTALSNAVDQARATIAPAPKNSICSYIATINVTEFGSNKSTPRTTTCSCPVLGS